MEIGIPKDKQKKGSNPRSYGLMLSEIVLKRKGNRKNKLKYPYGVFFHHRSFSKKASRLTHKNTEMHFLEALCP